LKKYLFKSFSKAVITFTEGFGAPKAITLYYPLIATSFN